MKKIKSELSVMTAVLMCLVILIHVISEGVSGYDKQSFIYFIFLSLHRLSSFAVQGFIFLSGLKLFLKPADHFSYPRFYFGRIKKVIIPYIIAFSLFYIFLSLRGFIIPSSSLYFSELFLGGLVNHFYFVIIICQFYILMPLWRLIYKKSSPLIAMTVSLILMIMLKIYLPEIVKVISGAELKYNARIFTTYLFYFVAGIFAGKYYDRFSEFLKARRKEIIILFIPAAGINIFAIWLIESGRVWLSWADMFHIIYSILAILLLASLSLTRAEKADGSTAVSLLNAASYNVYLIHPLIIFIIEYILEKLGATSSISVRFIIKFIFTYLISVGGCLLIEYLKSEYKKTHTK